MFPRDYQPGFVVRGWRWREKPELNVVIKKDYAHFNECFKRCRELHEQGKLWSVIVYGLMEEDYPDEVD